MEKFIIGQDFWDMFPEAEIAVVIAENIDNSREYVQDCLEELDEKLTDAFNDAKDFLGKEVFSDNRVVSVWRDAYRKFRTKKGARCSIEALLKRVEKGKAINSINPLVDIYNIISLTYGLPCGGEDRDLFCGDLLLTTADGGEKFTAIGEEKDDPALEGELIYKDDEGAVCRCWNWRDGQRTMLTEMTGNAFLVIESVDPGRSDDLKDAAWSLANMTQKYLGGNVEIFNLNTNTREMPMHLKKENRNL